MLVGIDASRAIADRPTGTETYSRRLIQGLLACDSGHRLRLYFRQPPPEGLFSGSEQRVLSFPRLWTHLRLSWEVARHPPQVLFVPAHVIPLLHPCPTLVTVHDLGYLCYPDAHPWRQRLYLDLSTRWNAHTATHLLADSQATRSDLVGRYGVPPNKITVAYPGIDEFLRPVQEIASIAAAKARYNISGDYFLYLGTLQPRKNLVRLVKAFARFAADHPAYPVQLVLAGKRGWLDDDLTREVERQGLGERVIFPGYISGDDKAPLLTGALAFVFPSLYEGFGLPVLEAQACGCPVITSTTSSLPEIAGDAALLVDPEDTAAIAAAIECIATQPRVREQLVERGFANARRFSWKSCVETVFSVLDHHFC